MSQAPFGYLRREARRRGSIIARATRWHRPAAPPFLLAAGVAQAAQAAQLFYDYRSYRWVVPLEPGDVHPWNSRSRHRELAEARDGGRRRLARVHRRRASDQDLESFLATGQAGQRRLLLLGGEAAALLLAFVVLAASGLRRDAEASRRRLTWLGATRPRSRSSRVPRRQRSPRPGPRSGGSPGSFPRWRSRSLRIAERGDRRASVLSGAGLAVAVSLVVATAAILLASVWSPPRSARRLRFTALDFAAVGRGGRGRRRVRPRSDRHEQPGRRQGDGSRAAPPPRPRRLHRRRPRRPRRRLRLDGCSSEQDAAGRSRSGSRHSRSRATRAGRRSPSRSSSSASASRVFAAVYRSTLTQGQHDQAAYAVPAAAIVSEDNAKLVRVLQAAPLSQYQRYGPAAQVIRLSGNVPAGAGFTLLGMPSGTVADVGGWRSGFSSLSRPELAQPDRARGARAAAHRAAPGGTADAPAGRERPRPRPRRNRDEGWGLPLRAAARQPARRATARLLLRRHRPRPRARGGHGRRGASARKPDAEPAAASGQRPRRSRSTSARGRAAASSARLAARLGAAAVPRHVRSPARVPDPPAARPRGGAGGRVTGDRRRSRPRPNASAPDRRNTSPHARRRHRQPLPLRRRRLRSRRPADARDRHERRPSRDAR